MMLLLLACADPDPAPATKPTVGSDPVVDACTTLPALPVDAAILRGFTGSEDFAFDGDGNVVGVDENGNLVRVDIDGGTSVLLPGFGDASGIRFLPGGDLVIGD